MTAINDDQTWAAVYAHFEENALVENQLSSYNALLDNLPNIVEYYSSLKIPSKTVTTSIKISNLVLESPQISEMNNQRKWLFPTDCIQKKNNVGNYGGKLFVDISITKIPVDLSIAPTTTVLKKKYIGDFPIMVYSKKCNLKLLCKTPHDIANMANHSIHDKGGYFISRGKEKAIIGQETSVSNEILVFKNKKQVPAFTPYYAEIRSYSSVTRHSSTTQVGFLKENIFIQIPYVTESHPLPLSILFKALGIDTHQKIFNCIFPQGVTDDYTEKIISSLEFGFQCNSQEFALNYIGVRNKKTDYQKVKTQTTVAPIPGIDTDDEGIDDVDEDVDVDRVEAELNALNITIKNESIDAISFAENLLIHEFLPHLNDEFSKEELSQPDVRKKLFIRKAYFLGYMVSKLIEVTLKKRMPDDRDHYVNKLFSMVGTLLESQFTQAFKRMMSSIKIASQTTIEDGIVPKIESAIKPALITNLMFGCLSNNKWNGRQVDGVSQPLDRFNLLASFALLRKSMIQMDVNGKVFDPRKLNPSHWGVTDPSDTPEGKRIGLIHSLAMLAKVTNYINPDKALSIIKKYSKFIPFEEALKMDNFLKMSKIFVNGNWIGSTFYGDELLNLLKTARRSGALHSDISLSKNVNGSEISVISTSGRMCRPLFIVEKGKLVFTKNDVIKIKNNSIKWKDLLCTGKIEYLDKREEDQMNTLVLMFPEDLLSLTPEKKYKFTHCEITPSSIYGVSASKVPFPNHDQSPRVAYQCSMSKQAIGLPALNFLDTIDGTVHTLNYLQRPLAVTKMSQVAKLDELPPGQMAMVMICQYKGFGQEDSLILNQASIDRGFLTTTTYESFESILHTDQNEKFGKPTFELCQNFYGDNRHLDDEGIIKPHSVLKKGDIIIGKLAHNEKGKSKTRGTGLTSQNTIQFNKEYNNQSLIYEYDIPATVCQIDRGYNGDGYEYVKVVISQQRPMGVGGEFHSGGDKASSRHGQKGTLGTTVRPENLPFTENGDVPDLIVNPLAFPSRMTIAQLIESLTGKKLLQGLDENDLDFIPKSVLTETVDSIDFNISHHNTVDASPFQKKFSIKDVTEALIKNGFNGFGDEICYNGESGEPLKALLFYGPVYYQRLRHMILNKYHARSRGPRQTLTRQPREGRNQDGGYRLGWMEVSTMGANGASHFTKDRLFDQSDRFKQWVCQICGLPGIVSKDQTIKECRICNTHQMAYVDVPYGTKLMFQELAGMNIFGRILTSEIDK